MIRATGKGYSLEHTNHTEPLMGWPDSFARVWLTDGGVEVLVPECRPALLEVL